MIKNVSVGVDVIVRCCCVSACVKPLIDWQLGQDLTSLEKKTKNRLNKTEINICLISLNLKQALFWTCSVLSVN